MNSIINVTILDKIDDYLIDQDNNFELKLKNFKNDIKVSRLSFPNSWPEEVFAEDFKRFGFKSCYHLLNSYFSQYDEEVSSKQMKDREEYGYIEIEFYTIPEFKYKSYLNSQLHTFRVFLNYKNDKAINFRIIYNSDQYFRLVENFATSKRINLDNLETEEQKIGISYLEKVIYGICQKKNIEIPEAINVSKFEDSSINTPDLYHFIELIKLVTRNVFDDSDYKKDAKKLQNFHKKGKDEIEMHEKFRNILAENYFVENEICVQDSSYYSDWKFDPEDIELGITSILETEFTFDYPEETFAHELFPYIQTELAKQNLELMNIDTFGDSYLFFIANKNEVNSILDLSQSIGIKFEKLV